ncbi:hypothetical protein [Demequina iriomotensis]|uniref:hypothetical protein n=1 Tax=Demequina iriomotensis TaxID=1536641 RepID=UPI00078237BF|nr:hypothetical protein [Demequina iriomotensis]
MDEEVRNRPLKPVTVPVGEADCSTGRYVLHLPGLPFEAEGATFAEAIDAMIVILRDYSTRWDATTHDPAHVDAVGFIRSTTDSALGSWLTMSTTRTGHSTITEQGLDLPTPAALPREPVDFRDDDFVTWSDELWQIVDSADLRPGPVFTGRAVGSHPDLRWDPHRLDDRPQPDRAALYLQPTLTGAVVDRWADTRHIDTAAGSPWILSATPEVPLHLLDMAGNWALRNGSHHSLMQDSPAHCRAWIRAALDAKPDLDGVYTLSDRHGRHVVLYPAGIAKLPDGPTRAIHLPDPWAAIALDEIAERIGYTF